VNEYFGLLPASDAFRLFVVYSFLSLLIAAVSHLLFKDLHRSFIFTFLLLNIFFLFGPFKDVCEKTLWTKAITAYRYILPAIVILIGFVYYKLKKPAFAFRTLFNYLSFLNIILCCFEILNLGRNVLFDKNETDFGYKAHNLIVNELLPDSINKPDIFWIVLDEYSASSTLKRKWNYDNLLDTVLAKKGFFVAADATSAYNFTHYSIAATLDMTYLNSLQNGSIVRYRDMVAGDKTVYENNVVAFLKNNGYLITNFTLFDMKGVPAHPLIRFHSDPSLLVRAPTMYDRIKYDVGWNFSHLFSPNKKRLDSIELKKVFQKEVDKQHAAINLYKQTVEKGKNKEAPGFYMFHYMITHEPFVFNADGSLSDSASFTKPNAYISCVQYANKVIDDLTSLVQTKYEGRNFVIIVQSDHGFKFDEEDPFFEKESCKIFYAVYASDHDYSSWQPRISSVNGFRIIFNKYFRMGFPLLPSRSFNLRYRQ
jgi:hypothetical protein